MRTAWPPGRPRPGPAHRTPYRTAGAPGRSREAREHRHGARNPCSAGYRAARGGRHRAAPGGPNIAQLAGADGLPTARYYGEDRGGNAGGSRGVVPPGLVEPPDRAILRRGPRRECGGGARGVRGGGAPPEGAQSHPPWANTGPWASTYQTRLRARVG